MPASNSIVGAVPDISVTRPVYVLTVTRRRRWPATICGARAGAITASCARPTPLVVVELVMPSAPRSAGQTAGGILGFLALEKGKSAETDE